jgi:LCP family protein required for cell wall assembly
MRTTLKRGIGRGAGLNGNGHASLPPGVITPMARYRQPPPPRGGLAARFGKFVGWVIVLLLMLGGGALGGSYLAGHDFVNGLAPRGLLKKAAEKGVDYVAPGKPAVALIIGSDRRYISHGDPGRSDTLMLIRTDPETKMVSMLSFPRDLNVEIHCPGHGTFVAKINAAYSTCGPVGSLETVKALTGVPINYLISVNFIGFVDIVNKLGGVYIDVDRRYFNNHTGPFGYAAINLEPGYQLLNGKDALSFVRYRHTDSDLFRVARQQMFVRSAKDQLRRISTTDYLGIAGAIKRNVQVARSGGHGVDLTTLKNYAFFFHSLPGGHFLQVRIQGIEGGNDLTAPQSDINAAVNQFMHPDVTAAAKANAAALNEKYHPKVTGINPKSVFITVLNGNGVTGAAAVAGTQLHARNYQILQPPSSLQADSPDGWNHVPTRIFYDVSQPKAKASAKQVAKLFSNASTGPLTPRFAPYANGATLVVVVGKSYQGQLIGPSATASTPVPRHQTPHTIRYPGASLSLMRSIRRRVPFRVEYPTVIDRSSRVDPEPPNPRVYTLLGHRAIRLVFTTGVPGQYWGVEETNWNNAPALAEKNFHRSFGGRKFIFYYSGANLHMVVLKEFGATYWVVNTLDDALSNETMIAIARGLRPLS